MYVIQIVYSVLVRFLIYQHGLKLCKQLSLFCSAAVYVYNNSFRGLVTQFGHSLATKFNPHIVLQTILHLLDWETIWHHLPMGRMFPKKVHAQNKWLAKAPWSWSWPLEDQSQPAAVKKHTFQGDLVVVKAFTKPMSVSILLVRGVVSRLFPADSYAELRMKATRISSGNGLRCLNKVKGTNLFPRKTCCFFCWFGCFFGEADFCLTLFIEAKAILPLREPPIVSWV